MNTYKISCHSECGSYFGSYLQSVSVNAQNVETAYKIVKKYLKDNGRNFIREEKHWHIEDLGEVRVGVFDYTSDSDY